MGKRDLELLVQQRSDAAPGFAGATDLPASRDPALAFRVMRDEHHKGGDSPAAAQRRLPGVSLENWMRLAPVMGLADFITADATFDQLASVEDGPEDERVISEDVFTRYCERIGAKSKPGTAKVGGMRKGATAATILEGAMLSADEKVLLAGGMPLYVVQDMTTTPRTSGTIILTTHALYWRPNRLRPAIGKAKPGEVRGKLKRFDLLRAAKPGEELDGGEWLVEASRAGPFGLGVTDTVYVHIYIDLSISAYT